MINMLLDERILKKTGFKFTSRKIFQVNCECMVFNTCKTMAVDDSARAKPTIIDVEVLTLNTVLQ